MEEPPCTKCPGCGKDIDKLNSEKCFFKSSSRVGKHMAYEAGSEEFWLCKECKFVIERHYGQLDSVTPEDGFTLLYSKRSERQRKESCCENCQVL